MSHNRFEFEGLRELRDALRNLPAHLTAEASEIVMETANEAKSEIVENYAEVSGDLKGKVSVQGTSSGFAAGAVVKSTAPHAHLYEFGSQVRHTDIGANRGAMPPRPTFVPVMTRKRRQMYERLKKVLERNGLVVSGDAG